MSEEKNHLTGDELLTLARQVVDRNTLRILLKDEYFRDFARIVHLMCLGSVVAPGPTSTFSHYFVMRDKRTGDPVEIIIDLQIKGIARRNQ